MGGNEGLGGGWVGGGGGWAGRGDWIDAKIITS